jgi:hypothetical protein
MSQQDRQAPLREIPDLMTHFDEERILALARVLETFAAECVEIALAAVYRSEYEHIKEAGTAFLMLRGHAVALNALAALGPQTYPSGWPIARSMFEVGVRSAWRMDVDNPFEGEARWATWLERFVKYERRRSGALQAEGLLDMARGATSRADQANSFRIAFLDLLKFQGLTPNAGEPPMNQVMESLGQPAYRYQIYADASERLHGSFVASEAYTRNLGTQRTIGDYARWIDWVAPLATGMRGVQALSHVFADRVGPAQMDTRIAAAENDWEQALRN